MSRVPDDAGFAYQQVRELRKALIEAQKLSLEVAFMELCGEAITLGLAPSKAPPGTGSVGFRCARW